MNAKRGRDDGMWKCAAGVFIQPYATQLELEAFENAIEKDISRKDDVNEEVLTGFLGKFGRNFYEEPGLKEKIRIKGGDER